MDHNNPPTQRKILIAPLPPRDAGSTTKRSNLKKEEREEGMEKEGESEMEEAEKEKETLIDSISMKRLNILFNGEYQ